MNDLQDKRFFLVQHAPVVWLTGLSGSGKTTLAGLLRKSLMKSGFISVVLDGDEVRNTINKDLGFSIEERQENIRRMAEVSKLLIQSGIPVIASFISPTKSIRETAANIIGKKHFVEVYLDCPFEICKKRDVKGLYKEAGKGNIQGFTGMDSVYEPPETPFIVIRTGEQSMEESSAELFNAILPFMMKQPQGNDEAF